MINIIGDSIAAGEGSSLCVDTEELIFVGHKPFYRKKAPHSWWGLLAERFEGEEHKVTFRNNGCCGAYSYEILEYLDELVTEEDDVIMLLLGLNDRKRIDGMKELAQNMACIIDKLLKWKKKVIVLTPNPSAYANEHQPNRLYHTEEVVQILKEVAARKKVDLIDQYQYIMDYLAVHNKQIEELIYHEGKGDGLHPSDSVQQLMYENVLQYFKRSSKGRES